MSLSQRVQDAVSLAVIAAFLGLVLFIFCGLAGCSAEHWAGLTKPVTRISYSPLWGFSVTNSKDVSVKLEDLTIDPETQVLTVARLSIQDMSSPVIAANVEQINAAANVQAMQREYVDSVMDGLSNILIAGGEAVVPGLQVLSDTVRASRVRASGTPWGDLEGRLGSEPPTNAPAAPDDE